METGVTYRGTPPCLFVKTQKDSSDKHTIMLKFGVIVLFQVYLPTAVAETCAACKATYDTDKPAAVDEAAKCAVLATYLHCLEGSGKDDAGCPLVTADADAIEFDYSDFSCSGKAAFTDTCICQKEFWKTDQSAGNAAICRGRQHWPVMAPLL
ncbi:uncharacterized protein LOC124150795 [Haliotis rufescens]|uniref:uncharacterized protein LOC124150795 n=1 Tax=Haliotis rufescens TaxID=6454 RepID=UPI00201F5E5B|nr:uncharacterized protein LOC124150795 [Haliotis rufescens]